MRIAGKATIGSLRTAVLLGAGMAALLLASGALAQVRRLNLVCSAQIEWCELIQAEYQKASGVRVTMIHRSSIEALALLLAERKNPRTDVWFGGTGDPHLQAAEQGLTLAYKSRIFEDLQPWAQAQAERAAYRTVGVYSGVLGFAYRADQLARINAEPPGCWRDLVGPQFAGQVMMGNPGSSGTGFLILAALTQILGEDAAIAYLKTLHRNIAQYTHGGRGSIENVVRGEATVAIGFMHDAIAARERGADLEFSLPCEGTVSEIGSMSLIAGSANIDEARLFYEWALSSEAQTQARQVSAFQFPSNRRVTTESRVVDPGLNALPAYDHRKFGSAEVRKRLLGRWLNEVNVPDNE
jgi:iron(III) transport system substrate-binding protein